MSASTHEAVLGGARWRLTLHPDGRWDVAKLDGRIWDERLSGNNGAAGLKESVEYLREIWTAGEMLTADSAQHLNNLAILADVAERSTTP